MDTMLRYTLPGHSQRSLLSLSAYRDVEQHVGANHSTTEEGSLLEYHHLELRVHPPNVELKSTADGSKTILTIDSANRPGTLVEVVQCLTEMGLDVSKARISSDGGWFVDEFEVDCVTDPAKEAEIMRVLTVEPYQGIVPEHTVFELSGPDRAGLLADVVNLLKHNGCDVDQLAVWTSNQHMACVVAVTHGAPGLAPTTIDSSANGSIAGSTAAGPAVAAPASGTMPCGSSVLAHGRLPSNGNTSDMLSHSPMAAIGAMHGHIQPGQGRQQGPRGAVRDPVKLQRLQQLLAHILQPPGTKAPGGVVQVSSVKGGIHFERRLHQLLMRKDEAAWEGCSDLVTYYESLVGDGQADLPTRSSPDSDPAATCRHHNTHNHHHHNSSTSWQHGMFDSTSSWMEQAHIPCTNNNGRSPVVGHHQLLSSDTLMTSANNLAGQEQSVPHSTPSRAEGDNWVSGSKHRTHDGSWGPNNHHHVPESAMSQGGASAAVSEGGLSCLVSPKCSQPEVMIRYNQRLQYWLLDIRCKDRKKLFFDTVCTIAELQYDIFHASVDVDADTHTAHQVYYVRRCTGDSRWNQQEAAKLCFLLEAAISRRFPKGVEVRIQSWQQYDLAALTAAWRDAGLTIMRAKVRPCARSSNNMMGVRGAAALRSAAQPSTNTFYLLDQQGQAPDPAVIQHACTRQGGVMMEPVSTTGGVAHPPSTNATAVGYAGSRVKGGIPPRTSITATTTTSDVLWDQLPKGAAFGFALLQRQGVGSPSSMSSSM